MGESREGGRGAAQQRPVIGVLRTFRIAPRQYAAELSRPCGDSEIVHAWDREDPFDGQSTVTDEKFDPSECPFCGDTPPFGGTLPGDKG